MDVTTMIIPADEAARKVRIYSDIPEARRTEEDAYLLRIYKAVGKGKRLLDVGRAFRDTGLHKNGYPKLAIARANTDEVHFHPRQTFDNSWSVQSGSGGFSPRREWDHRATRMNFALPLATFDNDRLVRGAVLRSNVPHVPPELRPAGSLGAYHILFEATWIAYPVDPFLLRHLAGMLFTVEQEWELTELEASLLSAMHST